MQNKEMQKKQNKSNLNFREVHKKINQIMLIMIMIIMMKKYCMSKNNINLDKIQIEIANKMMKSQK